MTKMAGAKRPKATAMPMAGMAGKKTPMHPPGGAQAQIGAAAKRAKPAPASDLAKGYRTLRGT